MPPPGCKGVGLARPPAHGARRRAVQGPVRWLDQRDQRQERPAVVVSDAGWVSWHVDFGGRRCPEGVRTAWCTWDDQVWQTDGSSGVVHGAVRVLPSATSRVATRATATGASLVPCRDGRECFRIGIDRVTKAVLGRMQSIDSVLTQSFQTLSMLAFVTINSYL